MNATTTNTTERRPANPVLWLVIGLPALAVAASFVSLALAVTHGDKELPAAYHWEGAALAGDEARIATAARMGIVATLQVDSVGERCTLQLAGASPAAVRLDLSHPTDPAADRQVPLARNPDGSGRYEAPCATLAPAHWWVQVSDAQGQWLLRGRAAGALDVALALSPQGSPGRPAQAHSP